MTQVYTKRRLVPGRVVLFGIVLSQITVRVHQPLPLLTPTGQEVLLVVLKAIIMLLTLTKPQVKQHVTEQEEYTLSRDTVPKSKGTGRVNLHTCSQRARCGRVWT